MPIAEKKNKGQFDKLASVTTESIQYFQFSFGIQSQFDVEQMWDLPIYHLVDSVQHIGWEGENKQVCFHYNFGKFQWISIFCQECYYRKIYEWEQQFLQSSVDLQSYKALSGPWTFRLCQSLDICKNYYSHSYFEVVYHYCALVEIGYQFFLCFVKIIKQASIKVMF